MSLVLDSDALFEPALVYPDIDHRERLASLVGLDNQIDRLGKILGTLVNPSGLDTWINEHHPDAAELLNLVLRRPPLVVLAGDVGSGKTVLAESIGDRVARQEDINLTLYPMSLSSRGQGRVGEMTKLITEAFDFTCSEAGKIQTASGKARGAIILLVDEADALVQSREAAQMHHEDRAGVNAFIRGIDRLAVGRLPAAVLMCTNRLGALDPAIQRRAAEILSFSRPTRMQRAAVIATHLKALNFSDAISTK
jgi:AAA+ superfamily predicted ATPase